VKAPLPVPPAVPHHPEPAARQPHRGTHPASPAQQERSRQHATWYTDVPQAPELPRNPRLLHPG